MHYIIKLKKLVSLSVLLKQVKWTWDDNLVNDGGEAPSVED